MIKGVNLGNWLVLEKWMSPGLFAGTEAEDETQPSCDLADVAKRERLTAHRDSYITERDFAYLARHGIDTVEDPGSLFHLRALSALRRLRRVPGPGLRLGRDAQDQDPDRSAHRAGLAERLRQRRHVRCLQVA